jgi:hypothetical protein
MVTIDGRVVPCRMLPDETMVRGRGSVAVVASGNRWRAEWIIKEGLTTNGQIQAPCDEVKLEALEIKVLVEMATPPVTDAERPDSISGPFIFANHESG